VQVKLVHRFASILAALALSGCAAIGGGDEELPRASAPSPDVPSAPAKQVTKLLVFVVENHSLDQMSHDMPYTFGLAKQFGYATEFTALTHPSLPNYLAMAGGSTFGVTDDDPPASHPVSSQSVFGQAISLGKTATLYAEGMPGNCALEDGGARYAVKHNPWAYFVEERDLCDQHDISLTRLAADISNGDLPNAGMVIPNLCNDAHDADCDLGDADRWMEEYVGMVLAGPDFASGHLAVVVTADEDDLSQDNKVLTAVFHPSQRGNVVDVPLTTYSLTRLYEQVVGAPFLNQAATAPDLAEAFGLSVGPRD
jgi:phosphatidylinositol-3-phosphatase